MLDYNVVDSADVDFVRDNILPIIRSFNREEIREQLNKLAAEIYKQQYDILKDEWHRNEEWKDPNNFTGCYTPSEKYGPEDFEPVNDIMGGLCENYKMNWVLFYYKVCVGLFDGYRTLLFNSDCNKIVGINSYY